MSRRTTAKKRLVSPDPIYRSRLVSMMLSRLLQDGKKNVARQIFYNAMELLENGADGSQTKEKDGNNTEIQSTVSSSKGNGEGIQTTRESRESLKIFQQAVLNVTPVVEVKSRRVGGSNYQVPLEVSSERGTSLALRWLVQAARQRSGREMATKLANELMDASNKTGNAIRKREETHRMAEANKAFASYRF